ncbi:MAG TPA: hypothetical protein PKN18_06565, partial [Pseudomonadales bacterium]|nr:hypothetical protein [Pseudomonadales bacterium]
KLYPHVFSRICNAIAKPVIRTLGGWRPALQRQDSGAQHHIELKQPRPLCLRVDRTIQFPPLQMKQQLWQHRQAQPWPCR